jgi:hypothetical protein
MMDVLFACLTWAALFVGFRKQVWRGRNGTPASVAKSALLATLVTGLVTLLSLAKFSR